MSAAQLTGRRKSGAALLAGCAAALWWAGWALGLLEQSALIAVIGTAPIAALILVLFARGHDVFASVSAGLLALFPIAALAAAMIPMPPEAARFLPHLAWPLILSSVAASLALATLGQSRIAPLFAQAAAVLAIALAIASMAGLWPMVLRWGLASVIHVAIWITSAVILCAIFAAGARAEPQGGLRRFISGLTQLLPLLGFAGTILGIMRALTALPGIFEQDAAPDASALQNMLGGLGTAFETTLLGVGAAIVLSFLALILLDSADP